MKRLSIIIAILFFFTWLAGQGQSDDRNVSDKYKDTSLQGEIDVVRTNIEDFEDASSWLGSMPREQGLIRVQRRENGSQEVDQDSKQPGKDKNYCLGSKVAFFKSGLNWFAMSPPREIHIPGVTKELQVWVHGRNKRHLLSAIIRDIQGRLFKVEFGRLNFPGWNKLSSRIGRNIDQDNPSLTSQYRRRGIKVNSMLVETHMEDTHGLYYLYLDNLVAETDMFAEKEEERARESGDYMSDDW
ncbi:MAG TPA: flagellar filament outer layer protein FlaA [Spirochaetota bacterium]|nr:flagellar filament outer layer protein FlaA [Spirochaetota bacterium]